ncbi:GTPase ObgE [Patescibacteria group bacterium]|nr:GTPase ObgE [Patescibacteria group bacterium]MBU4017425.1 GTPase ObgE [Patescibacteria group bacterium]MBU4098415.1 GTPase ObgE [Patescibacteria group bacterium]
MLVDDVIISVKAGDGGNGAVAFFPNKGGPAGGNGGKGGDIYLIGSSDIEALSQFKFKKSLQAQNGEGGGRSHKDGLKGKDLYIKVPVGTRISVDNSKWIYEIQDTKTPFLLTKGGIGGRGNDEFKSSTNQAPRIAENGKPGQEKIVHLQLRLIANIGFIGLPNAGKSSLLASLTNASPKIADYPFTTLEPNLGVIPESKIILADIPGLIEGASRGRGLGIKFLKHIEKTQLLAHCIDVTIDNPVDAYTTVRAEFEKYNPKLLEKKEIIILTKTDLIDKTELKKKIKLLQKRNKSVETVSILDDESLKELKLIFEQAIHNITPD